MVLAAHEAATGIHTWRNPTDDVRRYFAFLAANGYTLSEVEQLARVAPRRPSHPERTAPPHDRPPSTPRHPLRPHH
jgi:hypothetical protein